MSYIIDLGYSVFHVLLTSYYYSDWRVAQMNIQVTWTTTHLLFYGDGDVKPVFSVVMGGSGRVPGEPLYSLTWPIQGRLVLCVCVWCIVNILLAAWYSSTALPGDIMCNMYIPFHSRWKQSTSPSPDLFLSIPRNYSVWCLSVRFPSPLNCWLRYCVFRTRWNFMIWRREWLQWYGSIYWREKTEWRGDLCHLGDDIIIMILLWRYSKW